MALNLAVFSVVQILSYIDTIVLIVEAHGELQAVVSDDGPSARSLHAMHNMWKTLKFGLRPVLASLSARGIQCGSL